MSEGGRRLVRGPSPGVMSGQGGVWLLESAGAGASYLSGASGELVLAVLSAARVPASAPELVLAVAAAAGVDLAERRAIDEAVELLVRTGALIDAALPAAAPAPAERVTGHVLVAITGAIAAAYAPSLVRRLHAGGHVVRVAMTRAARRFIAPRTFEALTHLPVATGLWGGSPTAPAPHIELARWADVVVVYPCTATTLSRLASGDCSELVSATATTTRAPVLLVPSMNVEMYAAPRVADNLERLVEHGFFVAHPGEGQEVADAPRDRVRRPGVAARVEHVVRCVTLLLEREAARGPRILSRAEWRADHRRRAEAGAARVDVPLDADLDRVLRVHAPCPSRVLDLGTGFGDVARAAARMGHTVVATDFSTEAITRAHALGPEVPVTWLVDDATESALRASFDVCIDRGCLGCVPESRRARYVEQVAKLVRPRGVWILKTHRAPLLDLRAHAFTVDEVARLAEPWFEVVAVHESRLSFGGWSDRPAWTFELRHRG